MALTKTKTDLSGTQAAKTSVTTGQVLNGSLRNVTGKVGLLYTFTAVYSGVTPTVRPKLELFTAAENDSSYQDVTAYETVELPAPVTGSGVSATYQTSVPIRFAEDIMYINWKITAPTFSAGTVDIYLGITETSL